MSTDAIEKPAAAAPADKAADKPATTPTPAVSSPTEKPVAAAPAADKPAASSPADKAAEKPAAAAKPAGSFLDDVEDDDDGGEEEATAPAEGDKQPEEKKPAVESKWPDDWREKMANGDEKYLKELKRFKDFDSYTKSQRSLRQKISSGELKRAALPEDATPEEVSAWRKDNGIPETHADYALPEKVTFTDTDKPLVDSFLAKLHSANTPAPIAKAALEWYGEFQQQAAETRAVADREASIATEDKYRSDWGADFKANLNIMKRVLKDPELMPEGLGSAMADARMADGSLLRNHPAFFQAFANLARKEYGEASMIPSDTMAQMNSREDELTKMMKTNYDDYMMKTNSKGQTFADELLEIRRAKEGSKRR